MYYNNDDLEKATGYYERTLEIRKEKFGANHVEVAHCFMWLGNLYNKKGDLEKAKDYCERALAIRKEQLGPNHVDVIE
jgi:tetratricopeptide (TPR) repeat protein